MRFREIKTSEKITDRFVVKEEPEKEEAYRQIKSEKGTTGAEARAKIDALFAMLAATNRN